MVGLAACSSVKTSSDYEKTTDFTQYKNFTWIDTSAGGISKMATPMMDTRIRNSIEQQLVSQGYQKTDAGSDLYVNYSVLTEDKVDITTHNLYGGYGAGWGWRGGYGYRGVQPGFTDVDVREYKSGTLLIDFIDPASNKLIWRGMGSKRIPSSTTPEKLDKLVNTVVESILNNFPPQ